VSEAGRRRDRGSVGLYAGGFVLLLGSAYTLARGNLESSLRFVWLSIGLSALSVATSVVSLFLPSRTRTQGADRQASEQPPLG
jgi:hypothetical protein